MGFFQKLKEAANWKKPGDRNYKQLIEHRFFPILKVIHKEASAHHTNSWEILKFSNSQEYEKIKDWSSEEKMDLVAYLHELIDSYSKFYQNRYGHKDTWVNEVSTGLLSLLLKQKIAFTFEILWGYLEYYKSHSGHSIFYPWPVHYVLIQMEKIAGKTGLNAQQISQLEGLAKWPQLQNNYEDPKKAQKRISNILFLVSGEDQGVKPYHFSSEDEFGSFANSRMTGLNKEVREQFDQLFELCSKANQSKPSKKFLDTTKKIVDEISIKKFKSLTQPLLESVLGMKETEKTVHYPKDNYTYRYYTFMEAENSTTLKGIVWVYAHFHDSQSLALISRLAERAFKKIPGVGPAAAAVGNACIYTLANSKGYEGVSHLSRLKLTVNQNNTQKLIQDYINGLSAKLGMTPEEIEDISAQDFDLNRGSKDVAFKDYILRITILGIGKIDQQWIKPDGNIQKTTPSFLKESKPITDKLKKVKAEIKLISKMLTASRDRLDRSLILDRKMNFEYFLKYYLDHGLMHFLTKSLLWRFESDTESVIGRYGNNKWLDVHGREITWITDGVKVSLWHPVSDTMDTIVQWRETYLKLEIVQTIKQVFREVYLLTDAEVNTRVYSNRMAAHIIKQHQFNALTSVRGWKYQLLGAFDDGRDGEWATKDLPTFDMHAEFWIIEIYSDDGMNDTGIWNYVSTDQVRFVGKDGSPIQLVEIPKVVLSEILRDVDLFVGVCSVGNDPEWMDNGGNAQHRDYWQSYSFGELNEIAKTRKSILERILPKLKIGKVSAIEGKFLVVKGKIRTYKIHLGSTNILMEPNDQYLCIVPSGKRDNKASQIFLPFEGDKGLSIILSKAFLLADDDKIKDVTIINQIKG